MANNTMERLALGGKYFYPPTTEQERQTFASRLHPKSAEVYLQMTQDFADSGLTDGPLRLHGHPIPIDYFTRSKQGRQAWDDLAQKYPHECSSKTNSMLDDPGYKTPAVLDANAQEAARIRVNEAQELARITQEKRDKQDAERRFKEDFEKATGLPYTLDNYIANTNLKKSPDMRFHIAFGIAVIVFAIGMFVYLNWGLHG
ncbi:hypothetical protein [Burkholderia cenocepacia]|uniref:hypothetical protein n=1 Tax=Burkholderia cenocepacia TaxID=95486 RepID=UPI002654C60B|nr:hypothetical protein [Burkholderia cenocepacia]MDN7678044.1 hypothetical protein [Burkholderia cenocepacia]